MRRWLPETAFDRPVSVLMVFVALLVLGTLAATRIPLQMLPGGFEARFLWVQVPWANATPLETDEQVVRPILEQLSTLSGVSELDSYASTNNGSFGIDFQGSVDMDQAYNEVVDRIERALPDLPDDVDRYFVRKFDPNSSPVLWAGVTFPEEVDDPYQFMNRVVVPRIERVPGVASVELWGVNSQRVFVEYDRDRMMSHGVNIGDVQSRLSQDNFQMSGGQLDERGQVRQVRSLSRIEAVDDLEDYPIDGDGLTLTDVAEVSFRGVASADIDRVNGRNAAAMGVQKESSANTVEVTRAVHEVLDALATDPRAQGVSTLVFFDQGELVSESMDTLRDAALTGGLFSVLILYLFLREARMTLLISASIPFSLLITVTVLYFRGDSLNIVSMMGLMLAVGMVVDNAIVVVESIYRRRAEGVATKEAAISGTAEVNVAILASTATTMVVFLPVILMTEDADASKFLQVLGLPVVFALAASLLVALVFAPLATRYIQAGQIKDDPRWLTWIQRHYRRALDTVLRRRADATIGLLATLLLTITVAVPGVQCNPSGGGMMNDFVVRFTVPRDATYRERTEIVGAFEEVFAEHQDTWGIRSYRARLRSDSTRGRIWAVLDDDAPMTRSEVLDACREVLPEELPGVTASIGWEGGGDDSVDVRVYGEEVEVLQGLADEVVRRVEAVDGVLSAQLSDAEDGRDEIRLLPDRDALARYGVTARTVAQTVAFAMRGSLLEPILTDDGEIEIETRLSLADREDLDTLLDFPVFSPAMQSVVPVRALAEVTFGKGPQRIKRTDGRTSVSVTADLDPDLARSEVMPRVDAALAGLKMPRGYSLDASAWAQEQSTENEAILLAMVLSICFVFFLLGVLFESWVLPLSILTTIPMAAVGAFWGLYLTDTAMDTMAGIGLVVLVGVVVNNGIVLVDLITQLRAEEGYDRDAAIREACERRLRPILMTAVTTICGLIPMAMGSSDFAGIPYAPMGRTVIGGLTAATLLTLVFVPYLYAILDDVRDASRRWARFVWEKTA